MSKTNRVTDLVVSTLLETITGDLAARISSFYKEKRHHEIASLSISDISFDYQPHDMSGAAARFRMDYRAVSLLSKANFLDLGIDRRKKAIDKWRDAEETCRIMNSYGRLLSYVPERGPFEHLISSARVLIRKTLGEFTWDHIYDNARFSGGASTSRKRRDGHPIRKYQDKPDVTPNCLPLAIAAVRADQQWFYATILQHGPNPLDWFRVVSGSKLDTVPKNSKVDRVICIEPDINMMFQLGIGSAIRSRLKRVGVNLNDQSLNQQYARIGSSTGALATLDLAAASDSISLELVRDLLPCEWFDAMYVTRSHVTHIEGEMVKLEKISSMGNGYTFELESLIFWALSQSVINYLQTEDRRLAIYGDDIVIHNSAASLLIELLAYVGFQTNVDKSFISGPFRESCGKHYFLGHDVTPFYIKNPPHSLMELFRCANAALYQFDSEDASRDIQLLIPYRDRLRVPRRFGLTAGLWTVLVPHRVPRMKNWVYVIEYYGVSDPARHPLDWAGIHYALGYGFGKASNPDSRKVGRTVRKRTVVSTWD